MLADQDNPLEAIPESDSSEPKVIVIYRSRGVPWLLIPPLLLVVIVAAIIIYRKSELTKTPRETPLAFSADSVETSGAVPSLPTAARPEPARLVEPALPPVLNLPKPATEPLPVPDLAAQPKILEESQPSTAPPNPAPVLPEPAAPKVEEPVIAPPEIVPEPVDVTATPPVEPAHREPVGFDPEAMRVAAPAVNEPKAEAAKVALNQGPRERRDTTPPMNGVPNRPLSDEILDQMQREAEERLAERARLESARPDKPDLLNPDPREVRIRRHELIATTRRIAAQDRGPFHAELRQLLAEQGNRAGSNIQQLCNRYGRDTMPEIHFAMNRDLRGPSSRLSTSGRIQRMRTWGIPETIILDDLVLREIDNVKTRGGPRNEAEAWVCASRVLLSYPPTTNSATTRATGAVNPTARTSLPTPGGL